jgi:hypothetical protein
MPVLPALLVLWSGALAKFKYQPGGLKIVGLCLLFAAVVLGALTFSRRLFRVTVAPREGEVIDESGVNAVTCATLAAWSAGCALLGCLYLVV